MVKKAAKELRESITGVAPIFAEKPFFMSDEFTLVDCITAPIFWRLGLMEIELPEKQCKHMLKYMDRIFAREAFLASLSDTERDMRRA